MNECGVCKSKIKSLLYCNGCFQRAKSVAERRGRVEELKVWETMLDDTILADETDGVVACKDLYVIRERMQNRLLDLANEGVCVSQKPKVFEELEE
jgi:hypothetical protein